MTAQQVKALLHQATKRIPHAPGAVQLAEDYIKYMDKDTLLNAARCYAAIVGERTLPRNWRK
jgi:hypothetical protein